MTMTALPSSRLQITQDHLRALYDNVPYRFTVYDSRSIGKVRQFAQRTVSS